MPPGIRICSLTAGTKKTWVAIPATTVEKGAAIKYYEGMVMKNFTSKTLDRTFDTVVFSSGLAGEEDETAPQPASGKANDSFSDAVKAEKSNGQTAPTPSMEMSGGSVGAIAPLEEILPLKKQLLPTVTPLKKFLPRPKNSPVKKFRSMAKSSNSAR